ncbi:transcriptional regulator WhiB-like [Mycobacterium phage Bromden]|uniref:WhiB family transcription factor n=1 Tax=Mycobacterium phage Bromden TaxID=2283252 RepID=A0A345MBK5_9CAUD|nr:transcriptional regulator WhiB-like [Mycobacterium phage Bromden]AXH67876.1 WhiB family transcription factor [Mycobacterium phage Bromden]
MSAEIKALMSPKPLHWTDEALCHDDDRFTGRREWLTLADRRDMRAKCGVCPVFDECWRWARDEQVIEVFAAGYWRNPDGRVTESD